MSWRTQATMVTVDLLPVQVSRDPAVTTVQNIVGGRLYIGGTDVSASDHRRSIAAGESATVAEPSWLLAYEPTRVCVQRADGHPVHLSQPERLKEP
jgi:hypothetical protein